VIIFLAEPMIDFAREGNCFADKLANMGHLIHGAVWLSVLPPDMQAEFYLDRCGILRYRFPKAAVCFMFSFLLFLFP